MLFYILINKHRFIYQRIPNLHSRTKFFGTLQQFMEFSSKAVLDISSKKNKKKLHELLHKLRNSLGSENKVENIRRMSGLF